MAVIPTLPTKNDKFNSGFQNRAEHFHRDLKTKRHVFLFVFKIGVQNYLVELRT